ncbi:hypothetical protein ACQKJZ_07905 [Sphingomonas sp. NPDC019816]|uniref:hypothetical protein n=1 Tax=unclassified Sphingomonas TaxID=196159 RepID=UPI002897DD5A|nr:hypothetical protein [Sphingomonas sp.]
MSRDAVFFRTQAEIERGNAADASLQNVRERCERAAASWEAMAIRAERAEQGRAAAAARSVL